jgi:uncharacterized protein involved in exopolysaccharide biosynthesis
VSEGRVIRKLLEAFFRHKLLLLLPPVILPAIVTPIAIASTPVAYETVASVWIDHPAYLNYKDGAVGWVSAVQTHSTRLGELLKTRAFVTDVIQRTSLAPLLSSQAGQARIADLITKGVIISGGGGATSTNDHLMVLRTQASTAQGSYELCKAILDAYQEKSAADQADQVGVAVDYYQSRVQDAQAQLAKASGDLRRYISSKQAGDTGDGTAFDPTSVLAAMTDPKLSSFQDNVQSAQADLKTAQSALNQAQQDNMMWTQGQQYGFQVLDPPQPPTAPVAQLKKIIIYPIAGALGGLGLAGILLVLLVASDRSMRSEIDLAPGQRLLGTVPYLRVRKMPKALRGVATRRAIGSAAGMALPSPGGAK